MLMLHIKQRSASVHYIAYIYQASWSRSTLSSFKRSACFALHLAAGRGGPSLSKYSMVVPSLSWEVIAAEAKEVLVDQDIKTYGQFKTKLAAALGVAIGDLKQYKVPLQEAIIQQVQKEGTASDEERQENENESSTQAEDQEEEEGNSKAFAALRAMARAMNLGPQPFRGLKQVNNTDAERILRGRLMDAGAPFKGPFPSGREIAQARRKTEAEKDLDGIDLGNVVQGSRRRGRSDEESKAPNKRMRAAAVRESDSERSEKDNDDEDSEEEFRLSA